MSKQKKIIGILSTLVLIVLLWIVFSVIRGLFERKITNHELYIPENAESVLEIKSEPLIRSFVEDLLELGTLDKRFNEFVRSSEDSTEPLGIDYLANCYIFTFHEKNNSFTGILLNISDEDQFKNVMDSQDQAGFGCSVKNGVGLILYQHNGTLQSSGDLAQIASNIIDQPGRFNRSVLDPVEDESKINYWSKEYVFGEQRTFKEVHLTMAVDANKMSIEGNANFESTEIKSHPILQPNDLSIQTQLIPSVVNEFWLNNMQNLDIPLPKLTYISGNYHYSEPSPVKELMFLPNFDGIYAFDENFQIRIPLIALAAANKINSLNLQSFKIGDKKIFYKQIDPKTVYLGQSQYEASTTQNNVLLEVNGDLKQLLEIRNGGNIERFLRFSSEYNAAERFLSGIDESNFHIRDEDGSKLDILAELTFDEGKSALNETIVLLMGLGLFD